MGNRYLITPLGDLRWHWGEAYQIDNRGLAWVARRRDDNTPLHADSSEELRAMIIADYTARRVER